MLRGMLLVGLTLIVGAAVGQTTERALPAGKVEIAVEDLHCASCAKKVARKLYAVKGVLKVSCSLKADLVTVFVSTKVVPTPVAKLWLAVEAAGVPPVELRHADQRLDADAIKPLLVAAAPSATPR